MANKVYRFAVRGKLAFPLDMLRYDACYPATQEAITEIHDSFFRHDTKERVVELTSQLGAPTGARWSSFGWRVENLRRGQ